MNRKELVCRPVHPLSDLLCQMLRFGFNCACLLSLTGMLWHAIRIKNDVQIVDGLEVGKHLIREVDDGRVIGCIFFSRIRDLVCL